MRNRAKSFEKYLITGLVVLILAIGTEERGLCRQGKELEDLRKIQNIIDDIQTESQLLIQWAAENTQYSEIDFAFEFSSSLIVEMISQIAGLPIAFIETFAKIIALPPASQRALNNTGNTKYSLERRLTNIHACMMDLDKVEEWHIAWTCRYNGHLNKFESSCSSMVTLAELWGKHVKSWGSGLPHEDKFCALLTGSWARNSKAKADEANQKIVVSSTTSEDHRKILLATIGAADYLRAAYIFKAITHSIKFRFQANALKGLPLLVGIEPLMDFAIDYLRYMVSNNEPIVDGECDPTIILQEIRTKIPYSQFFPLIGSWQSACHAIHNSFRWRDKAAGDLISLYKQFCPSITGLSTALVLDWSGSMKGQKLEKAKQAASAYIADMRTGDCGAVVAFSTTAKTLKSAQCISSTGAEKEDLKGVVGSISATNSTNIAAGLSNGMDELPCNCQKAAALLLSDGKHNVGPFSNVLNEAEKYRNNRWKIFTVAFGKDANLPNLCKIARITDGACAPAGIKNLIPVFQRMSSYARNKSISLSLSEHLPPGTRLTYEIPVDSSAKVVTYYLSWEGSKLEAKLIQPDGKILRPEDLHGDLGRYEEGKTYHMMEVNDPQGGKWGLQIRWKIPPPVGEQVNILVSEKSDIFATILPFYNEYKLGQPVNIKVQIAELVGNKRVSLKNAAVRVEVKKPGPEMIRMVQAQSQKFTMYKDVMLDITRKITLFDHGAHNDYDPGDGIFGNVFAETDKNGAYLVTAVITGKKKNGEKVEKTLQASFQVGPISQNIVTTSQVLHYMDEAKSHIDDKTPYKEDILRKPIEDIEQLQGDPLDSIEKLLRGE